MNRRSFLAALPVAVPATLIAPVVGGYAISANTDGVLEHAQTEATEESTRVLVQIAKTTAEAHSP